MHGNVFETLKSLNEDDLNKIVYIRNMGHSVTEAMNRQLAHYPYHIGQIVFIGKWHKTMIGIHCQYQKENLQVIMRRNFLKKKELCILLMIYKFN